jgi:hypothetical protein
MPGVVLAIESDYEPITSAAWDYRQNNVYPFIQSKGFQVHCLSASSANADAVRDALTDPSIVFITGSGHGSDTSFTGYGDLPIFEAGLPYPGSVSGKIVHLLSCGSAHYLGHDFIQNGATAFFGYDANFSYLPGISALLFDCDAQIDLALADGATAAQAMQRAIDRFNLILNDPGTDATTAAYLRTNLAHLKSPVSNPAGWWGAANATL